MFVSVCATDDSSAVWLPTDARSGLTPRSKPAGVAGAVALRSVAPRSGGWSEAAAGADCLLAPSPRSRGGSWAASLSVSSALGLESLRLSKHVRCRRLTGPAAPEALLGPVSARRSSSAAHHPGCHAWVCFRQRLLSSCCRVRLLGEAVTCSPPGSPVSGISQARTLQGVAISFSAESSQTIDRTRVSRLADKCFTTEPWGKPISDNYISINVLASDFNFSYNTLCGHIHFIL